MPSPGRGATLGVLAGCFSRSARRTFRSLAETRQRQHRVGPGRLEALGLAGEHQRVGHVPAHLAGHPGGALERAAQHHQLLLD